MSLTQPEAPRESSTNELSFEAFVTQAEERTREIGASPDLVTAASIGMFLRRLNKWMDLDAEEHILETPPLTWSVFRIAISLWVFGSLEPHRAASLGGLSKGAVSAARKTLEELGWATSSSSETDLRSIVMSLTELGKAEIELRYRRHLEITSSWLSPLSLPEKQVLSGLLAKVMTAGRAEGPSAPSS